MKRIAIQHPYAGTSENQSVASIIAAAKKLGVEASVFSESQEIIDFKPDFVLSISHQIPKLTPIPTYGVMTAPSEWYEKPRFLRNILTYDAYLTVTPEMEEWLEDICFGARKKNSPIGFYANTALPLAQRSPIDFSEARLLYVGSNWDNDRYCSLFQSLACTPFFNVSGPEQAWNGYGSAYIGQLPYDPTSVLSAYQDAGVGLCIEHPEFIRESMPSNRIYETLASGALAICARTPFNKRWFGENVLYVDMDLPSNAIKRQIVDHMTWIRDNPDLASKMARQAHQLYCQNFSLVLLLQNLFKFHAKLIEDKGYVRDQSTLIDTRKVGIVIRAGSRGAEFLHRSIGSVARQSYQNTKVYLVLWQSLPDLKEVLKSYPELDYDIVDQPDGIRSDCQWAGLKAAKKDGCELIGILDDDDEYHVNMVHSLVKGYEYHQNLSFSTPIVMICGGSAIAHSTPQMNYSEFEVADAVPRADTRHIQHFHFATSGQVNDRSYAYSQCSILFVAEFLDEEVLQNPKMDLVEDWMIWLQLAERGRAIFIPEVVSTVHEHEIERAGYRGKTDATFNSHARIARRMYGRRFNSVEHYHAPAWLNHDTNDTLMATWASYPEKEKRPNAQRETELDADILSDNGIKVEQAAGYCELHVFLTAETSKEDNLLLNIVSTERTYQTNLNISASQKNPSYQVVYAKFFVTKTESEQPLQLQLITNEQQVLNGFMGCRICQRIETGSHSHVKFSILKHYENVWLYGASKLGEMALNILATEYLKPAGVADTFQRGEWNDFRILSPEELKCTIGPNDVILISSEFWEEISSTLIELGIPNHLFTLKDQRNLATVFDA